MFFFAVVYRLVISVLAIGSWLLVQPPTEEKKPLRIIRVASGLSMQAPSEAGKEAAGNHNVDRRPFKLDMSNALLL